MPQRGYVADPSKGGSHHNRAAAVDLTLVTKDGAELEMPSGFDTFGRPAHHWYQGGTEASKKNRQALRDLMEGVGLERNPMEWWHYQLVDAIKLPLRDEPFADAPTPAPASPAPRALDGGR
jgi:D-alanyl-D-alanine dipeptidase